MSYIILGGGAAGGHGTDAAWKDHVDVEAAVSDSDAQGDVIYRDAMGWNRLAAGTSGYFLKTQGAAADPVWAASGAVSDHGGLAGLTDDDHTQYLLVAGTRALSADWDAGSHEIRAETLESDVATGTAPLTIASTTVVANLNVSALGGKAETAFLLVDGSRALTADWDAGSFGLRAQTLESDVATGTAPLTIASTTVNSNLNADMLDGVHSTNLILSSLTFIIDNAGTAITTGIKGHLEIPFACTINRATALADQSGSIVVDIWKDTYAAFLAGTLADADSITSAAPVTITTAVASQDSTLTDWTTAVTAGDILAFNVDSCTTITRCTISLRVVKT